MPLAGVTVSISPTQTALTDESGAYAIRNLALEDSTVTFAKEGFP